MFRVFGGVLVLAGPLVYISQPHTFVFYFLILILLLGGTTMILLRYGLAIDIENRKYRIYSHLLGLKFGPYYSFKYLEKYFINEVNNTTVMTTGAGITHDIKKSVYQAYMKLDNGEKIHVDTDANFEKLKSRVENYIVKSAPILKSKAL